MCLVCVWCKGIFYKLIIYVLRYLLWDDDVTTCLFFAYGVFLSTLYNHLKWCTFGNAWPFMKLKSIHYIITFHSLTLWIIILLHHYVNLWNSIDVIGPHSDLSLFFTVHSNCSLVITMTTILSLTSEHAVFIHACTKRRHIRSNFTWAIHLRKFNFLSIYNMHTGEPLK